MTKKKHLWLIFSSVLMCCQVSCLAAKPWQYWNDYDNHSTKTIDHSAWQTFLNTYVQYDDGTSVINYERIGKRAHGQLRAYLRMLSKTDIHTFNRQEQLAYWLNLHNALTVDLILQHRPPNSILDIQLRYHKPSETGGPWHENIIRIHGTSLSLFDIEQRIIKPFWQDVRTNFALHHGVKGYPNLHSKAFTAANLDKELDIAKDNFLQSTKAFELKAKTLNISKWFKRYQDDFGETPERIIEKVRDLSFIPCLSAKYTEVQFKDLNWALNSPKS